MNVRVGLPRAMGYYYYYPFFRTLLLSLGAEPVLSPKTTPRLLERMDTCPTDEPCLAVKLHFSHADALAHRHDINFLLLPSIARVDNVLCCPKFIGISDMLRHGLRLPATRCMQPVLNFTANDEEMAYALQPLAERLGVTDGERLQQAIHQARRAQQAFRDLCVTRQLTTPEAFHLLEHGETPPPPPPHKDFDVAVIGHPYILYEAICMDMIEYLRGYGPVVTAEMVDQSDIVKAMSMIPDGERMWPFEAMLLGAALHLLRNRLVSKMLLVGSFECGPESIIEAYIEEEAHRQGIPFMILAVDEHSGEAGLTTRLEAFMDTEKVQSPPATVPPELPPLTTEKMVVGFPSMGYLDIAIRTFTESFGIQTLPTPKVSKSCIEMGQEIAPEFVCFPFTATLGQMRMLLDQGANTLLMVGGKGHCRLGWYAQVQERLLKNMGYDFQLLLVDSPFPLREKWGAFRQLMKTASANAPWPRIVGRFWMMYQQLAAMDRADAVVHRLRAFERERGAADRVHRRYQHRLTRVDSLRSIRRLERDFLEEMASIETEETNPLRIRIAGEIWVVLEPSATRDVERWLGSRDHPRVWVDRELSASSWFDANVMRRKAVLKREQQILDAAHPWLSQRVGGHGIETIGEVALAREEGMDGVIHVFPFTCMPEIIAQNILVRMSEELDIPVLTYIVSEQMGEAGMETRLESFLDLLEERRLAPTRSLTLV